MARLPRVLLMSLVMMLALARPAAGCETPADLTITHPIDHALFPADMAPPLFSWQDESPADSWILTFTLPGDEVIEFTSAENSWRPDQAAWARLKQGCGGGEAVVAVQGVVAADPESAVSMAAVSFGVSADPVGAPILFREVPLPVELAIVRSEAISWKLGRVDEEDSPRVILTGMNTCSNCHSASSDGAILGMDVDVNGDKGAYILCDVGEKAVFKNSEVISWNDYGSGPRNSFGLFSRISPDGNHVVSTVKDVSVYRMLRQDIGYSQLFFPVQGILVVYDRAKGEFQALPGADSEQVVQSNPAWSPDGREIVFARGPLLMDRKVVKAYEDRSAFYTYDLYHIPFNGGQGGEPEPLAGASGNGMSNYFPAFSPDGKWIVFTRSQGFMIIQPDAELWIVPAAGGEARKMACNLDGMCSWHSFSPNGRWLVFSSKQGGPYTRLWLTHIDAQGNDSPPVLLDWFTSPKLAANIPEFLNIERTMLTSIDNRLTQTPPGEAKR